MRKNLLSMFLVIILVASTLSGCGASPQTTGTSPVASNAGTTTASSPDSKGDASAVSGKLEVAVFSNGDIMDRFWNTAVEEFKAAYPNVDVTLIANPKIEEQIRPRIVAGNVPDLYYMGGTSNMDEAALTADGKFMKLNEFLDTAPAIGYDGLVKDNLQVKLFNKNGDDVYGVSFAYGVQGYYYNVGMAEKYGWNPPKNWEEFLELAPKIKEKGIYPIIHQGKYPDYLGYSLMQTGIATLAGKELLVRMGNLDVEAYKSEVVLSAYKKYEVLRDNDWTPKSALSLTHTEAQMEWLQDKAFLIPCGNWLESEMAADIPDNFKLSFKPTFWFEGNKTPVYNASSARISVFKDAKNPEAAKGFLRVLYSKNMTKAVVECGMGIPVVKDTLDGLKLSVANQCILSQASSGEALLINEVGGSGNFEPYGEQRTVINNNIAAILGGQKNAEQALEDIIKEIERIKNDATINKVPIS